VLSVAGAPVLTVRPSACTRSTPTPARNRVRAGRAPCAGRGRSARAGAVGNGRAGKVLQVASGSRHAMWVGREAVEPWLSLGGRGSRGRESSPAYGRGRRPDLEAAGTTRYGATRRTSATQALPGTGCRTDGRRWRWSWTGSGLPVDKRRGMAAGAQRGQVVVTSRWREIRSCLYQREADPGPRSRAGFRQGRRRSLPHMPGSPAPRPADRGA